MTQAAGAREQTASPWKHMLASVSTEEPAGLHWNCCVHQSEVNHQEEEKISQGHREGFLTVISYPGRCSAADPEL